MGEVLALTALALFAAGAIVVTILAIRRLYLAREERRRRTLEPELRPIAFALIDGERVDVTSLDERESQVLASMLGRYGHQLTGTSRKNIAFFFETGGHVFRELSHTRDRATGGAQRLPTRSATWDRGRRSRHCSPACRIAPSTFEAPPRGASGSSARPTRSSRSFAHSSPDRFHALLRRRHCSRSARRRFLT